MTRNRRTERSGGAGIVLLVTGILIFVLLITPVSAAALTTPVMVSPPDKQHFFHYPRITTLACKPVLGANGYIFEVQYYDYQWNYYRTITRPNPYYTFDFIGDQQGRWRVTAVDTSGFKSPSKASTWRTFDYDTDSVPLATPTQVSPATGVIFYHAPRETTVTWKQVPGADGYTAEVQYYDPTTKRWYQNSGSPADVTGYYPASYTFEFAGQTQGKWRVRATDSTSICSDSEWSAWRTFKYNV